MLVKVKSETGGPIMVPYIPKGQISQSTPNMILLVDGWNEIEQDIWPLMETTMEEGVQSGKFEYLCKTVEVEVEELVDGKPTKVKKEERIQQSLTDVRADKARQVVKECYNPHNLESWSKDPKITSELRALADIALGAIAKLGEA